jgi:hypothetical protein
MAWVTPAGGFWSTTCLGAMAASTAGDTSGASGWVASMSCGAVSRYVTAW